MFKCPLVTQLILTEPFARKKIHIPSQFHKNWNSINGTHDRKTTLHCARFKFQNSTMNENRTQENITDNSPYNHTIPIKGFKTLDPVQSLHTPGLPLGSESQESFELLPSWNSWFSTEIHYCLIFRKCNPSDISWALNFYLPKLSGLYCRTSLSQI